MHFQQILCNQNGIISFIYHPKLLHKQLYFQVMSDLRATSLIQQHHPKVRRNMLNKTVNRFQAAISNFQSKLQPFSYKSNVNIKQNEKNIKDSYLKINSIIDKVDEHIAKRLENHESEVFDLVREEIEQMRKETQETVDRLNQVIEEKNTNDEIWILNNELDYFKSISQQLYCQNKKIKQENKGYEIKIDQFKIQLENADKVMQKLRKKYLKEKIKREKTLPDEFIQKGKISLGNDSQINRFTFHKAKKTNLHSKTEISQSPPIKVLKSRKVQQSSLKIKKSSPSQSQNQPSLININMNQPKSFQEQSSINICVNKGKADESSLVQIFMPQNEAIKKKNSSSFMQIQNQQRQNSRVLINTVDEAQRQFEEMQQVLEVPSFLLITEQEHLKQSILQENPFKPSQSHIHETVVEKFKDFGTQTFQEVSMKVKSNEITQNKKLEAHSHQIDFLKNGFIVKSYNKKDKKMIKQVQIAPEIEIQNFPSPSKKTQFMSDAFSKCKFKTTKARKRYTNHSTFN